MSIFAHHSYLLNLLTEYTSRLPDRVCICKGHSANKVSEAGAFASTLIFTARLRFAIKNVSFYLFCHDIVELSDNFVSCEQDITFRMLISLSWDVKKFPKRSVISISYLGVGLDLNRVLSLSYHGEVSLKTCFASGVPLCSNVKHLNKLPHHLYLLIPLLLAAVDVLINLHYLLTNAKHGLRASMRVRQFRDLLPVLCD